MSCCRTYSYRSREAVEEGIAAHGQGEYGRGGIEDHICTREHVQSLDLVETPFMILNLIANNCRGLQYVIFLVQKKS